jgi:hypothetical protein
MIDTDGCDDTQHFVDDIRRIELAADIGTPEQMKQLKELLKR